MTELLDRLVALSRDLGDPAADLAILGEGNTSIRVDDTTFLVKASGASLAEATAADFVEVDRVAVLDIIGDPTLDADDLETLGARLRDAVVAGGVAGVSDGVGAGVGASVAGRGSDGSPAARPSIETMLHAVSLDLPGVGAVGHTHPVAVNGLLCSDRAAELVRGAIFPDQVVVCGADAVLVPYAEPGLPLGRAFRDGVASHCYAHGGPPKLVYLGNHGIVALGADEREVRQITAMAVKSARILTSVLSVGVPNRLPRGSVEQLWSRPDEQHRRAVLAARRDGAATPSPAATPGPTPDGPSSTKGIP